MNDLKWTDEPPEEEGWYRMKDHLVRQISRVYVTDDKGLQRVRGASSFPLRLYNDCEWAGPIPRPSDPHQDT